MGKLRKMSKTYYLRQIVACLMVYCILLSVPTQVALAEIGDGGWTIPAGSANITPPSSPGADTLIDVITDRAVINWQDFDTSAGQLVEFIRAEGANFAVLNRDIGGNATNFYGNLEAFNGDVFIVNTHGILFGPDSYIQARNFVASGIDIRNDDFMDGGSYQFETFDPTEGHPYSDLIGPVINYSALGIEAENVALIGQFVANFGTIRTTSPDGTVVMAAGESVLLSEIGSNVAVTVDMTDPGQHFVYNEGIIEASSGNVGKVVLAAGDIYSTSITGVDSLSAVARGSNGEFELPGGITLIGDFEAGEITLEGDFDNDGNGDVDISGALMKSTTGDIDISASDNTININIRVRCR